MYVFLCLLDVAEPQDNLNFPRMFMKNYCSALDIMHPRMSKLRNSSLQQIKTRLSKAVV